jgi:hypothetical protein
MRIARPDFGVLIGLADMVHDGERLPHRDVALDQHRHLSAGRMLGDLGLELRRVERNDDLLERDAELLQQDPRPQRPGGVELVGDDERWA